MLFLAGVCDLHCSSSEDTGKNGSRSSEMHSDIQGNYSETLMNLLMSVCILLLGPAIFTLVQRLVLKLWNQE